MSPVLKKKRPPISDAQAWRWLKRYYEARYGERITRDYGFGKFSALVPAIDAFVAQAQELQRAIHDPTLPDATEAMVNVADLVGRYNDSALGDIDSQIDSYGEAIAWGLRGEPQAELDAFVEKRAQEARDNEASATRNNDPAVIEACTFQWVEHCLRQLIGAMKGDAFERRRPLTHAERAAVLDRLRAAFELSAPIEQPATSAEVCQ